MRRLQRWIERQSLLTVQVYGVGWIAAIAYLQYLAGPELAFSIFYLLPVLLVGSRGGGRAAVPTCAIAAVTSTLGDAGYAPEIEGATLAWNLVARFGVFVVVASLRSDVYRQERLAGTDSLTGLANARAFEGAASVVIESSGAARRPLTTLFLDVDDFKSINDSFGHSGGDAALRAVANALRSSVREGDVVARVGGDEFVVLLPGTGSEGARTLLESLPARVNRGCADELFDVSFSIGAVTFLVPPGSVDDLIGLSDEKMYEAKRAGKGTFRHVTVGRGDARAAEDASAPRVRSGESVPAPP